MREILNSDSERINSRRFRIKNIRLFRCCDAVIVFLFIYVLILKFKFLNFPPNLLVKGVLSEWGRMRRLTFLGKNDSSKTQLHQKSISLRLKLGVWNNKLVCKLLHRGTLVGRFKNLFKLSAKTKYTESINMFSSREVLKGSENAGSWEKRTKLHKIKVSFYFMGFQRNLKFLPS